MSDEIRGSESDRPASTESDRPASTESGRPPSTEWGERLRRALIWAGIATVALIAALALLHLLADLGTVISVRGSRWALAGRLLPTLSLSAIGLGLVLVTGWLAAAGRRRELLAIAIGFATLIIIRVVISHQLDGTMTGEPAAYDQMAESFVAAKPDLIGRPPGYAALLAVVYALIHDRQLATEALNLLLALLAGGAVLGLTRGLYGPRAGALALLGYAVWPAAALMTVVRIPHTAFDLAIVAAAWAAVGMPAGWRGSALTGVLLGLAQYLRPTAPILLPAYIVARWWPGATWQRHVATATVTLLAFLAVLVPVMAYNLERTGSPSFSTSDYGGHTFYIGTYVPSGGTYSDEASQELIDRAGPDPRARSALGTELAIERIKADPLGMAALAIRKQDTLWGTERYGVQYAISQRLKDQPGHPKATTAMLLSEGFYALVLLAALGAMIVRRRQPDALVPLATLVIWAASATHALLEVRDRYHAFAVILLLPLAAYFVGWLMDGVERRRGADSAPSHSTDAIH